MSGMEAWPGQLGVSRPLGLVIKDPTTTYPRTSGKTGKNGRGTVQVKITAEHTKRENSNDIITTA